MYYLGIDPGLDGALVTLKDQTIIEVFKTPVAVTNSKKRIDEQALAAYISYVKEFRPDSKIVIEKLSNTGGRTGSFAFGDGYGLVRGMFIYAGFSIHYVRPQDWKKDVMPGMPADKIASCVVAARLYPESKAYMLRPRGGLHDGIGDAICIAEWGRRNL